MTDIGETPSARAETGTQLAQFASRFPSEFIWGAATAAYQIEGGANAEGKGASIWDVFCRRPGVIADGETGDLACDHIHRWREDIELMSDLGLKSYRFSISWPRVLPNGVGRPNAGGLDFYDHLVDELLAHGIEPFITLYHWDLPQVLQERGGWPSPDSPAWFAEYASVVARRLSDRVTQWATINEPEVAAFRGHATGVHAPGISDWRKATNASLRMLLGHREAATALRAVAPQAKVGIVLNLSPCEPATDAESDRLAAVQADGYLNRWFLDPLFGRGLPPDLVALYGELLDPKLVDRFVNWSGELDLLGVNYYTRRILRSSRTAPLPFEVVMDAGSEQTEMGWEVYPDGLFKLLIRLHQEYGPTRLLVTENGAAFSDSPGPQGDVEDLRRVDYLRRHIDAVAAAIEVGVPLAGYFVWTLMDNFEWSHGFTKRFGLIRVDYPTQRRKFKASASWYRDLIAAHRE
jgi:beta-glucosidase